jgi:CheY-like chemotaxis protein
LLLDLVLPDISGVEVVETLRRADAAPGLPILLLTGSELSTVDRQRLNGDVEAILAKTTLDVETLHREVDRVVRRGSP